MQTQRSAGDNCDNTTAIDYRLSDLVDQYDTNRRVDPCGLCGMVHPRRIHGCAEREFRDREFRENVTIVIPVIICPEAGANGMQHAKRLLQEFLAPIA